MTDIRIRRLVCLGQHKSHLFTGTDCCYRCGISRAIAKRESRNAAYMKHLGITGPADAPVAPPPPCRDGFLRHKFGGQPACVRCGASKIEHTRQLVRWHNAMTTEERRSPKPPTLAAAVPKYSLSRRDDPYAAGYEAFAKDLRNPFKPSDERHSQWFEGWHTAAAEADHHARKSRGAA